jgi:hypothetical protein
MMKHWSGRSEWARESPLDVLEVTVTQKCDDWTRDLSRLDQMIPETKYFSKLWMKDSHIALFERNDVSCLHWVDDNAFLAYTFQGRRAGDLRR